MPVRIGVLGGTFDPVHMGHLVIAEQCREQGRLARVLFIPAARPPHKLERQLTPWEQRVEMLKLACAGQPAFTVDELEKDRPGPSFTADTLTELHGRSEADSLCLILGADCLPDLASWHEPARIVAQAELLVIARPGWETWSAERLRSALALPANQPLSMTIVESPALGIASRELRARVRAGRTIRYLVPRAVECYIETHRLYTGGE